MRQIGGGVGMVAFLTLMLPAICHGEGRNSKLIDASCSAGCDLVQRSCIRQTGKVEGGLAQCDADLKACKARCPDARPDKPKKPTQL